MPPTNSYRGYSPAHKSETLDRIDPNFINQETFHAEYVAKRKPVIFTSILLGAKSQDRSPSAQSTAFRKWTDLEYLRTRAGSTIVKVEKKGPNGLFGSGQKRESMRFDELLDKLLDGSGNYYKTTQYEEDSPNSDSDHRLFLDFCQPPLTSLLGDFPLIPDLFESLIPQQVNLWLGSSAAASGQVTGASSGLHHDFADNLYVLLKGSKRFTIFSPKDSNFLYTYGKLSHVHPNGLQCYGSGNTRDPASLPRSDGAYPADVAKWRLEVAEENLRQAEESGDAEAIEHAEQEVDEAMDYMLQFDEEGEDDLDMFGGKVSKKKKKSAGDTSEQQQKPSEPPSFSRIDPDSLQAFVSSTSANDTASTTKKFPLVQKAIPISFVLHEGEMLYLPAGWFHEVTSFGSSSAEGNIHMAFNYWFHPPPIPTSKGVSSPYEDGYWKSRWDRVLRILTQKQQVSVGLDVRASSSDSRDSPSSKVIDSHQSKKRKQHKDCIQDGAASQSNVVEFRRRPHKRRGVVFDRWRVSDMCG